ncbi:hypothetical protein KM043_004637 [Ampulex compressa]|nr:hypothetical protein KM043_004637 [Ampulex compressa]
MTVERDSHILALHELDRNLNWETIVVIQLYGEHDEERFIRHLHKKSQKLLHCYADLNTVSSIQLRVIVASERRMGVCIDYSI